MEERAVSQILNASLITIMDRKVRTALLNLIRPYIPEGMIDHFEVYFRGSTHPSYYKAVTVPLISPGFIETFRNSSATLLLWTNGYD